MEDKISRESLLTIKDSLLRAREMVSEIYGRVNSSFRLTTVDYEVSDKILTELLNPMYEIEAKLDEAERAIRLKYRVYPGLVGEPLVYETAIVLEEELPKKLSDDIIIWPGARDSCIILHVPHDSRIIPRSVSDNFLIDSTALEKELDLMTDTCTTKLAVEGARRSRVIPYVFLNQLSRLVFDPERFPDEREEMNSVGMGAVYEKTSSGTTLRAKDEAYESMIIEKFYKPYAQSFEELVETIYKKHGKVIIIDVHSYRKEIGSNELNGGLERPELCIGTDEYHTPALLNETAREAFADLGTIIENQPFSGTYVPLKYYKNNDKIQSIMLEFRDDCLVTESLDIANKLYSAREMLTNFINTLVVKLYS